MSNAPSVPVRTAMLLMSLEPAAPRSRLESALVLLGLAAATLDEAVRLGVARRVGDRFDVVDPQLARRVVHRATDRERRLAHLALACARFGNEAGFDARASFDGLAARLDPMLFVARPADGLTERLTPREQHLAGLAATGVPIREIARASFLSQKTVECHLTRVYRKLGVRSKAELAFAFHQGLGTAPVPR